MQLVSSVWGIFNATFVFLAGILIAIHLAKLFGVPEKRSVIIYFWHTLLCFIYLQYVIANGGDAIYYYSEAFSSSIDFSFGTAAVSVLTYLLFSVFGLSFLAGFLVFNIIGFIGLLAFDGSLRSATRGKSKNIYRFSKFIVFLPSVSFWSSAIGKDPISFMATGLALWAALDFSRRKIIMIFAVIAMLLVRPHMAALMVFAICVSMLLQKNVPFSQRAWAGGMALAGSIWLIPFALNYSGLGIIESAINLSAYVEERQGYNQEGGGGVDIASMGLPMQLFTYLFRPLPFEVKNVFSFAASLDNMVLLLLAVLGGWEMLKRKKNVMPVVSENRVFMWVYSLSAWLVLAVTTANIGISIRQKWMFAPILIFLFISAIGRPRQHVAEQHPSVLGRDYVQANFDLRKKKS
jgi:hypothetical protein